MGGPGVPVALLLLAGCVCLCTELRAPIEPPRDKQPPLSRLWCQGTPRRAPCPAPWVHSAAGTSCQPGSSWGSKGFELPLTPLGFPSRFLPLCLLALTAGVFRFPGDSPAGGSSLLLRVSQPAARCQQRSRRSHAEEAQGRLQQGKKLACPPAASSVLPAHAAPGPGGWVASLGLIQQKQLVMFLLLPGVGCSFLPHKTMPSLKNKEIIKYI